MSRSAIRSATSRQITEILALLAIGCGLVACSSLDSGEGLASNGGTAALPGGSGALGQGGSSLSAASQQGGSATSGGTAVDAGGTSASGAQGGTEAGGNPAAVTTTPTLDVSGASVNRVKVVKVADRTLGFSTEAVGISTPMKHGIDTNPADRAQMIRGAAFFDRVDIVRIPYFLEFPIDNGQYDAETLKKLSDRIEIANLAAVGDKKPVVHMISYNHPVEWYRNADDPSVWSA